MEFHFHYKLSIYLEKCFCPTALTIYLQHRLKILRVSQDKQKTDLDPDPKSM